MKPGRALDRFQLPGGFSVRARVSHLHIRSDILTSPPPDRPAKATIGAQRRTGRAIGSVADVGVGGL